MNEPLKIMDAIERRSVIEYPISVVLTDTDWQSLRTALERQAEYVDLLKSIIDDKEAECLEQFTKLESQAEELAITLRTSLPGDYEAIRRSELDALHEELAHARKRLVPESGDKSPEYCDGWNNGYAERDEEGYEREAQKEARIARLEQAIDEPRPKAFTDWLKLLDEVLNESPAQSASALKAEALREAADAYEAQPDDFKWTPGSFLKQRADLIAVQIHADRFEI